MSTNETTPKLGITITLDDTTTFEEWRQTINGDTEESMANIIEKFAVEISREVEDIKDVLGDIETILDVILGI